MYCSASSSRDVSLLLGSWAYPLGRGIPQCRENILNLPLNNPDNLSKKISSISFGSNFCCTPSYSLCPPQRLSPAQNLSGSLAEASPEEQPFTPPDAQKKIPSSLQCKFQHSSHLSYAHLSATTPELSCHQIWLMKGDSSIMLILSRKWKKVLHAFYTKQHVSEFLCMCCGLSGSSSTWNMATEQSVPRTRRCSWQTNGRFSLISILCTHLRLSMLVLCWADPVQLLPATSVLMDSSPVCTARKVFVEDSPQAIVFNTQIHTRNSGLSEK